MGMKLTARLHMACLMFTAASVLVACDRKTFTVGTRMGTQDGGPSDGLSAADRADAAATDVPWSDLPTAADAPTLLLDAGMADSAPTADLVAGPPEVAAEAGAPDRPALALDTAGEVAVDLVCPTGTAACSGACVATARDPKNCGQCGHVCSGDTVCNLSSCQRCSDTLLLPGVPVTWGANASDVVAADLDRDGKLDLLIPAFFNDWLFLAMGKGDGTFTEADGTALADGPLSIIVGDWNGDGIVDLAAASYAASNFDARVTVMLGQVDGTFTTGTNYPGGGNGLVLAGDVDRDGNLDIVAPARILFGVGDGTFRVGGTVPVHAWWLGDLNGDGNLDLAGTSSPAKTVDVALGNGDGTFATVRSHAITGTAAGLAGGDLNGDGILDLAVMDSDTQSIAVLLGSPDGTFLSAGETNLGGAPLFVQMADLDGDSLLDVAVGNDTREGISVLLGQGDGTFRAPLLSGAGRHPYRFTIADLNADGRPDLAVVNGGGTIGGKHPVSILLGRGDGTFASHVPYVVGSGPRSLAVADLTGDRGVDVAVANEASDTVSVLAGTGDGTLSGRIDYLVGNRPRDVAIGDLNGDGRPDVATANMDDGSVSVLLASGPAGFADHVEYPVDTAPTSIVAADFDGDGRLDLATVNYPYCDGSRPGSVSILLGRGDGSFPTHVEYPVEECPHRLAVGDLDGDGKLDIAVANWGSGISVLINRGGGTFAPKVTYASSLPLNGIAIGDLNADGIPDLVVGGGLDLVSVLLGRGDGSFAAPVSYSASDNEPYVETVALADLNDDGYLDVATVNYDDYTLSVLPGRGDGTLGPALRYTVGSSPTSVVAADLDRDGRPDLVATNSEGGSVSVLLNRGRLCQ